VAPTAVEDRVPVRGVTLFTRTIGDGPDVVVLHGGPGAHLDYLLPQFDALADGRRLRYYDQRGGGRSPVERDVAVGWREHVADLDALLAHWSLSRATILGYSWGGLLAMLFAIEHPERVERLALVSPAPSTARGRAEFERRFAERMRRPEVHAARETLRASGLRERDPEAYQRRAFELSVAGYFHDFANVHDLTPFRVTGRTQHAVWASLGDYDLRDRLATLHLPARVFHGRYDPIPLETAEETARLLEAELVVFEHSGHVPYVEDADAFRRSLDAWLPSA
jgi:proline iminopeptidase